MQLLRANRLARLAGLGVPTLGARNFVPRCIGEHTVSKYVGREHRPAPKRPNFIPSTPNYFAYQWLDKDPDMDLIVGIIGEAGLSPEDIEHETEKLGHRVSRHTVISWLYGAVRRPQNYTLTIVAMA
jgi:hypothetical protein